MKKNNKILNDLQSALNKEFDEYKTAELKRSGKLPYTKKDELESWIHDLKEFERYKPYLKVFNNNLKKLHVEHSKWEGWPTDYLQLITELYNQIKLIYSARQTEYF